MLSNIYLVQETNFHRAWWQAIQNVLKGNRIGTKHKLEPMCFGTAKAQKFAYDSCQVIELTGGAIKQILNKETHPMNTFKAIASYCNEFSYDYLELYKTITDPNKKFDYMYVERLKEYEELPLVEELGTLNQITEMIKHTDIQKETKIASNYCQAITWYASEDGSDHKSSPCLQRIWTRWYPGDLIDLHLEWRSRDLIHAWQPNIIGLVNMMQEDVFEPLNCKLARVIDFSDSLHIYRGDIDEAKSITEVR